MDKLDRYKVDLKAVALDTMKCEWQLGHEFFVDVHSTEIRTGTLGVRLDIKPVGGAFKMHFKIEGEVQVPCDRCLEPMTLPIAVDSVLTAKWGDEYDDDGEVITVPEGIGEVNVAWNIYELVALEIPMRHVHPEGECHGEGERLFEQYGTKEFEVDEEMSVDERWNKLKEILDNNK
ncbi:MAG: YceD family protein [Bacteroidaceae bacterium]